MKKICIIGHFGFGKVLLNGQTIKTKIVTEEIEKHFGSDNVACLDLAGGFKKIPELLIKVPKELNKCDAFIMFPVENGLRFLTPLLCFWNLFFKKRLHYVVIGGWLAKFISDKKLMKNGLKRFNGIYVETNTMKTALEMQGFKNIFVMPNCKKLNVLSKGELCYPDEAPYKLCTFSRVMKEKGIETAVNAVKQVNDQLGYTAYSLDIYGQIDSGQTEWFEKLKNSFTDYINYCGCVDADKSVEVLQNYFALLFPTHFFTEGIPGTIIDAYAAGIPVISAKWESYFDLVDDGVTGIGYDFDDEEQFGQTLIDAAQNPRIILDLKENCIEKANDYIPDKAIEIVIKNLERE